MSTFVRGLPCVSLVCVLTATAGIASAERPTPLRVVGGARAGDPMPRSTYMVYQPAAGSTATLLPSAIEHAAPTIIYMNRRGGTFYPGNNDARTNRSSIPDVTSTIAPWQVSDANWQTIMTCIRDQFSRFNVVITDVDPGNVPHFESVVAGRPQDVGMENGVGGVSPFTSDCSTIPNSIVFTFAEVYGSAYRAVCETAAQEISHSFGLDHEFECKDPMTYLGGCGQKTFQDRAAPCGEYEARQCACGGTTQNSVQMLIQRLGRANTPPTVAITAPANGATVAPGFAITVNATDTGTVQRVELWIDGAQVETDTAAPWGFTAPATIADGAHTIEARAFDDGMATATATVMVTVSPSGGGGGGGGGGDGDGTGDGNPSDPEDPDSATITGGCATGGGSGLAVVLILIAFTGLALSRRHS